MTPITAQTALGYLASGLSCLPSSRALKRPTVSGGWKVFQSRLPSVDEVKTWFSTPHDAICVVTGSVSGNLECIDFDNRGELFAAWMQKIEPRLLARLVVERTQSGGYHVFYRSEGKVEGNMKLAMGMRADAGGSFIAKTLIETRGEGGLVLCAPSEGYTASQGTLAHLSVLSGAERAALLDAARALNEVEKLAPASTPQPRASTGASRSVPARLTPGDDYNERGDWRTLLKVAGWQFCLKRQDGHEYWVRPGKNPREGNSATYRDGCFYVFSTNAAPFEPNRAYSPFAIYATLMHRGDFTAAARDLSRLGFGSQQPCTREDISALKRSSRADEVSALKRSSRADDAPVSLAELYESDLPLKPVIIDGILRSSEIMNLIAAPKTGKSWLTLHLALSIASGREWLGHACSKQKVLYIDNELHHETSMNRLKLVLNAAQIPFDEVKDAFDFWHLRGKWKSVEEIGFRLADFKAKGYGVIIVDAFYRALPLGTDENDNSAITNIYNMLDRFAQELGCAFILIHHTSKGNQSQKSVTDVGAGAGAQSRAADTHAIIREHNEEGYLVLDFAVRSFPKHEPIVLKKEFPLMKRDYDRNPADLAGKAEEAAKSRSSKHENMDLDSLVENIPNVIEDGKRILKTAFVKNVQLAFGISRNNARRLICDALEQGLIHYKKESMGGSSGNAAWVVCKGSDGGEFRG